MKKILVSCLVLVLLLCFAAGAFAAPAIIDRADLFSPSEEAELTQLIADFRDQTGMDFVLLTSAENHGSTQQTVADEIYDRGGYGMGDKLSGALYYIDMYDRIPYLSTSGDMIDYMTDARIEAAHDASYIYLTRGDYAGAAQKMITSTLAYVKKGIPEGQYQYDVTTGEILTSAHKSITASELLVCALIGLVSALLLVMNVQGRYNLKGSTYEYDISEHADVRLTDKTDNYLRTTTTRTPKPKAPPPSRPSGGGGGFSRPGGSGVHHSSGGRIHGGGAGRRF